MSIATSFLYLRPFPFCPAAVPSAGPSGNDTVQVSGLALADAMQLFWNLESLSFTAEYSGTYDLGGGIHSPFSRTLSYTFTTNRPPRERVCVVPGDETFYSIREYADVDGCNVGLTFPFSDGEATAHGIFSDPPTDLFCLWFRAQNENPAGFLLDNANGIVIALASHGASFGNYDYKTSATFVFMGVSLMAYLYADADFAVADGPSLTFSLTPAFYTYP